VRDTNERCQSPLLVDGHRGNRKADIIAILRKRERTPQSNDMAGMLDASRIGSFRKIVILHRNTPMDTCQGSSAIAVNPGGTRRFGRKAQPTVRRNPTNSDRCARHCMDGQVEDDGNACGHDPGDLRAISTLLLERPAAGWAGSAVACRHDRRRDRNKRRWHAGTVQKDADPYRLRRLSSYTIRPL